MSRAELASTLAISPETVSSIESGRLSVSPTLARRIHFITGADPNELAKGADGRLLRSQGRPYTAAEFRRRHREHAAPPRDYVELLSQQATAALRSKLLSAVSEGRFAAIYLKALEAIEKL